MTYPLCYDFYQKIKLMSSHDDTENNDYSPVADSDPSGDLTVQPFNDSTSSVCLNPDICPLTSDADLCSLPSPPDSPLHRFAGSPVPCPGSDPDPCPSLSPGSPIPRPDTGPTYASLKTMRGPAPDVVRPSLPAEKWEFLFQQTVRFAEYQIERLRWRGDYGGVLPQGYDANSIAAQAIMEFLQNPNLPLSRPLLHSDATLPSDARSSVSNDSTVQRFNDLTFFQHEINRLVLRHVTRLNHLKENWLVSNEGDIALVQDMDGELVSPLELIPAPDVRPDDALLQKESMIQFYKLKFRFEAFIAKERRLINLFELGCDGVSKPQDLAASLKLGIGTIRRLRKRLQRKWRAFSRCRSTRK